MAKRPVKKSVGVKKSAAVKKKPWPNCGTPGCKKPSVVFHRVWKNDKEFEKVHACGEHSRVESRTVASVVKGIESGERDKKVASKAKKVAVVKKPTKKVKVKK